MQLLYYYCYLHRLHMNHYYPALVKVYTRNLQVTLSNIICLGFNDIPLTVDLEVKYPHAIHAMYTSRQINQLLVALLLQTMELSLYSRMLEGSILHRLFVGLWNAYITTFNSASKCIHVIQ